jgi:hypothetical protein
LASAGSGPFLPHYQLRPTQDEATARQIGAALGAMMGFICGLAWNALADQG